VSYWFERIRITFHHSGALFQRQLLHEKTNICHTDVPTDHDINKMLARSPQEVL